MKSQDILTALVEMYWEWIESFSPEFRMLIARWALLLAVAVALGMFVRFVLARNMKNTLVAQVAVVVLTVACGLAIPLDGLQAMSGRAAARIVNLALICWVFLPLFLPCVLIRTRGLQHLTRVGLYVFEALLIIIQWLALIGG
jgi:hypothetical protein